MFAKALNFQDILKLDYFRIFVLQHVFLVSTLEACKMLSSSYVHNRTWSLIHLSRVDERINKWTDRQTNIAGLYRTSFMNNLPYKEVYYQFTR